MINNYQKNTYMFLNGIYVFFIKKLYLSNTFIDKD